MTELSSLWIPLTPSPAATASRYEDRARAMKTDGADAGMMPRSAVAEGARSAMRLSDDPAAVEASRFVLTGLDNYRSRISRAIMDDDVDAVAGLSGQLDRFVADHEEHLRNYRNAFAAEQSRTSQALAADLDSVLDGGYKNTWGFRDARTGMPLKNVQTMLDETSGEAVARRATRLARELDIDDADARALTDRNDPLYPVFGRYGQALSVKPKDPAAKLDVGGVRLATVANLKSALAFSKGYRDRFGSPHELGTFLSEFDRTFNANGTVSGRRLLEDAAEGYLRSGDGDPTSYLSRLKEMRDLVGRGILDPDATKGETTGAVHEANSILGEYVRAAVAANPEGQVPLGAQYAAGLASAARDVAVANSRYGIDLRSRESGMSGLIAQMALKRAGVDGADDRGLTTFIGTVLPALDQYGGSDGAPRFVTARNGQQYVMPVPGPYATVEQALVSAVGRTLYQAHKDAGGSLESSGDLLRRLATDEGLQGRVRESVYRELRSWTGDDEVADALADRVYLNPVNGAPVTLERAVRDLMQMPVNPDGTPQVPAQARIAGSAFDEKGAPVRLDGGIFDQIIGNPAAVVPEAKLDAGLNSALDSWARWTKKSESKRKAGDNDVSVNYHRALALGDLVAEAGKAEPDAGVEPSSVESTVARAVAISVSALDDSGVKALAKSGSVGRHLKAILDGVKSGDPDMLLAGALVSMYTSLDVMVAPPNDDTWRGPAAMAEFRVKRAAEAGRGVYHEPFILRHIRQALAEQGVQITAGVQNELPQAVHILAARDPEALANTTLVKSGYLDPVTGKVSEKRLLQTLQSRSYTNPAVMASPDVDPAATDLARKARRVATTLMPETTAVGRIMSRLDAKYEADGYSAEARSAMLGRVRGVVSAAYRKSGAYGALTAGDMYMARSRRYPTAFVNVNNIPVPAPDRVEPTATPMTDDEFDAYVEARVAAVSQLNPEIDREGIRAQMYQSDVSGPRTWAGQQALQQKLLLKRTSPKTNGEASAE